MALCLSVCLTPVYEIPFSSHPTEAPNTRGIEKLRSSTNNWLYLESDSSVPFSDF